MRAPAGSVAKRCDELQRAQLHSDRGRLRGGAWNLQIFHWKSGITPMELSKDDDITAAVTAGLGTLEVTATLVRCPVVNFANLR